MNFFRLKNKISPYMFILFVIGFAVMFAGCAFIAYAAMSDLVIGSFSERMSIVILAGALFASYIISSIVAAYCFWGTYRCLDDAIILQAPPRKAIRIPYESIQYVGIDYMAVNGQAQFWIYAETAPLPDNYRAGGIRDVRISPSLIKIQYRPHVLEEMKRAFPPRLKRQLEKASTALYQFDLPRF